MRLSARSEILASIGAAVLIGLIAVAGLYIRRYRERQLPISPITYQQIEDNVSRGSKLTRAQLDDYVASVTGKRVRWQGEVEEVDGDYRVFVDVDGFFYDVEFKLEREAALQLKRGQEIIFVGLIDGVERHFLSCRVKLRNVQIEAENG